jgi:hypothetical protein
MQVQCAPNIHVQNLVKFLKITIKHKLCNKLIRKHHTPITAIYKQSFNICQQYDEAW